MNRKVLNLFLKKKKNLKKQKLTYKTLGTKNYRPINHNLTNELLIYWLFFPRQFCISIRAFDEINNEIFQENIRQIGIQQGLSHNELERFVFDSVIEDKFFVFKNEKEMWDFWYEFCDIGKCSVAHMFRPINILSKRDRALMKFYSKKNGYKNPLFYGAMVNYNY